MAESEQPHFHPISALPTIAAVLAGELEEARKLLPTLDEAKPYSSMDDATVERLFTVYNKVRDDLWLYGEQLRRWRASKLSPEQSRKVDVLASQLEALSAAVAAILEKGERLRHLTIDALLRKSDADVGWGVLSGKIPVPSPPNIDPSSYRNLPEGEFVECPRCRAKLACLFHADKAMDRGALEYSAQLMERACPRSELPGWVVGPAISGPWRLADRPSDVIQIWPTRGPLERLSPSEFTAVLDQVRAAHRCSPGSESTKTEDKATQHEPDATRPSVTEQHELAERLEVAVNDLARKGLDDMGVFLGMADSMPDFKRLLDAGSLDELLASGRFPGLLRYAKILEALALGVRDGHIRVPK